MNEGRPLEKETQACGICGDPVEKRLDGLSGHADPLARRTLRYWCIDDNGTLHKVEDNVVPTDSSAFVTRVGDERG